MTEATSNTNGGTDATNIRDEQEAENQEAAG
jgi:hypothetical protein